MQKKISLLFLCTGNSCRSQMAEGWAHTLKSDQIEAFSAGIEKQGLNSHAVAVMAEAGVDISRQYSKRVEELGDVEFDYVVTVCDHAQESCPVFPGRAQIIHAGFEDPPALAERIAAEGGTTEEQLQCYRKVRDQIREFVATLPAVLPD